MGRDVIERLRYKVTVVEPYMNNEVPITIHLTRLATEGLRVEVETDRGKVEAKREFP